ncbi:MSB1 [Cyberlindnera jadinii]|uniref:Rhodopsin n=1 Tax=Cyberlindnera jadinii (strain ATCC 18201 / CBS 1600 / BCRC 20928 / JCM 3617 / NBRC 0987 / NRRL Y-1542) TaxID=983966 RepID=A0A0H5CBZ0_CYBJN|nr:DUF1708-domain-containing protein [Cyberlindnera jadinii NRRL Y-1542]ODV72844.1 DUF1708-domain-containing protein [Cyberlindnera jadinii NRRL Y-1542]CEP22134.1 MSB1 [Cyberlindnera jadinii]
MSQGASHSQEFRQKGSALSSSPKKKSKAALTNKPLPLPETVPSASPSVGAGANNSTVKNNNNGVNGNSGVEDDDSDDDDEEFVHEFTRNDVRELIHCITQELKVRGSKTPLLLLAFRPKASEANLTVFLAQVIPNGSTPAKLRTIEKVVSNADVYTLITALKYLWARLPTNAIIGWDSYENFKRLEANDNYPKRAFLEYMPQCLSSPSHASIVYDFLDLIVCLASNFKENQLSGRKIAKMTGIWAFNGPPPSSSLSKKKSNSFGDGLRDWIPAADAMFHLLLSFLRSMLPEDSRTKLQLPRTLQALLASNSYPPPPDMTLSSTTIVSVPLVTIKTNVMSTSPVELINKIPKVLTFNNPDMFQAKEDFALLKSLCKSDDNILNKLSSESRRIMEALCERKSGAHLKAGWSEVRPKRPTKKETEVEISRVSIDDYFIWAWMASLSFEQTATKKKIFGKSLITEVVFDGFKKWIIVEEVDISARLSIPPLPEKSKVKKTIQPNYRSMLDDLPPDDPSTASQKKAKSSKKQSKPLPKIVIKREKSKEKPKTVSDLVLNPLKKMNLLHHQHQLQQQQQSRPQQSHQKLTMPKPVAARHISEYKPLEDVGGLPEIETNQYRLSIPLEGFGLTEYSEGHNAQYNAYDHDGYDEDQYNNGYSDGDRQQNEPQGWYDQQGRTQNQYTSPPQRQQKQSPEVEQGQQQEYRYWSSQDEYKREPVPQETIQDAYNHAMSMLEPSDSQEEYYKQTGSIENLSSMVDELGIQVSNVETKLNNRVAPNYDTVVPLPIENNEGPPTKSVTPSEAASSFYGRIPSVSTDRSQKTPEIDYDDNGRFDQATPVASYDNQEEFNQATPVVKRNQRAQISDYPTQQRVRSMVDDVLSDEDVHGPRVPLKGHSESYQNVAQLKHDNTVDIDEKRNSIYPQSILDGYGYTSTDGSPTKLSRDASFSGVNNSQSNLPQSLSAKDLDYIPDSNLPDIPIPVPSPPRSPVGQNKFSPASNGAQRKPITKNLPGSLSLEPVPRLSQSEKRNSFVDTAGNISTRDELRANLTASSTDNQRDLPGTPIPSRTYETPDSNAKRIPETSLEKGKHVPAQKPLEDSQRGPSSTPRSRPQRKAPSTSPDRHQRTTDGDVSTAGSRGRGQPYGMVTGAESRGTEHLHVPMQSVGSSGSENTPRTSSPLRPNGRHSPSHVPHQSPSPNRPPIQGQGQGQGRRGAPSKNQYPPQGYPSQGYPPQGYVPQGYGGYHPQVQGKHSSNNSASSLPVQNDPGMWQSPPKVGEAPRHNSLGSSSSAPPNVGKLKYPQPSGQGYYPPPQGYYPPPQGYPPQGYPPQGYPPQGYPPQGYPPQGYPPQGYPQYYPSPQGYYPPPAGYGYPPVQGPPQQSASKPTGSDLVLQSMPPTSVGNKLHHTGKNGKKNIRAALIQGDFGI